MDMNTILLGHIALAVTFLGITLFFRAKQPQNINSFYGYRTHFSIKNAEIWKEANAFSSDLFVKFYFYYFRDHFLFINWRDQLVLHICNIPDNYLYRGNSIDGDSYKKEV